MTATFYLFNVEHGQAAALHLPNNRWCMFDVGCTDAFSAARWIAGRAPLAAYVLGAQANFKFLKGTVSHLHRDHLADHASLFQYGPEFLKSVDADQNHLDDCYATCADASAKARVRAFVQQYGSSFSPATSLPDYGGVVIRELSLPVAVARGIGGDANARVNNASVVTRIDVYGNSILLCGDMQKEAWEAIIRDSGEYGRIWRPLLTGVDILVAPHHGHRSGYSTGLLDLAKPAVVLVSVVARDPNVDNRYSQPPVRGMMIGGLSYGYISTRQKGHIRVEIRPQGPIGIGQVGTTYWTFGDAAMR